MRKLITALIACLMASTSVVFSADLETAARLAPIPVAFRQTPAEPSPPETKPWMERHPVWFGLIVGASVGATWGALSCRDGCFPLGAGGAAMVGSWWGAGPGALIGWGIGRAK